jgi:predicted small secreted protein
MGVKILGILAIFGCLVLAGCANTVAGAGQDISKAGQAISKSAK